MESAQLGELALGLIGGVLAASLRASATSRWRLSSSAWALGVADHLLDLVIGQARAGADFDLLLLAGTQVLGRGR